MKDLKRVAIVKKKKTEKGKSRKGEYSVAAAVDGEQTVWGEG